MSGQYRHKKLLRVVLADCHIFNLTHHLTAVAVAYAAQFWQRDAAVFLVEFHALRVAKYIALSPRLEPGEGSSFL